MTGDGPRESASGSASGGLLTGEGKRSGWSFSIAAWLHTGVTAKMATSSEPADSNGRTEVSGVGAVPLGGERRFVGVSVVGEIGESTIT